ERHTVGKQIRQAGRGGVIVRIEHSESEEWLSAADVSNGRRVRDKWDLPQNRQGANLGDIEESFYATAREEVLLYQVEQVITPDGDGHEITFLQVDREQLCD